MTKVMAACDRSVQALEADLDPQDDREIFCFMTMRTCRRVRYDLEFHQVMAPHSIVRTHYCRQIEEVHQGVVYMRFFVSWGPIDIMESALPKSTLESILFTENIHKERPGRGRY
jgi:hypothetical protein